MHAAWAEKVEWSNHHLAVYIDGITIVQVAKSPENRHRY